jgi:hypothetical protein
VLSTVDGGVTWGEVTPAMRRASITGLFALDARHAWVGTSGPCSARRTVDGGRHWMTFAFPVNGCDSQHFAFINPTEGWDEVSQGAAAGSEGVWIFRTLDGGAHWVLMSYTGSLDGVTSGTRGALDKGCDKTGLTFTSPTVGFATFACEGDATLYSRTDDSGRSWQTIDVPRPPAVGTGTGFEMSPPTFTGAFGTMVAIGRRAWLYLTHDGGLTWSAVTLPSATSTAAVLNDTHWWASIGSDVIITTDSGAHWTRYRTKLPNEIDELVATSDTTAWALDGLGTAPEIARTDDGGATWHPTLR